MLTLNFRKSEEELPRPNQAIVVMTEDLVGFGYGYTNVEQWVPVAFSDMTGNDYSTGVPFKQLEKVLGISARDIKVSTASGKGTSLEAFLKAKFLWMPEEEYEEVFKYLGLNRL